MWGKRGPFEQKAICSLHFKGLMLSNPAFAESAGPVFPLQDENSANCGFYKGEQILVI